MRAWPTGITFLALLAAASAHAEPLVLEAKIPLDGVRGRIDHLAYDPGRQRLYVAELGNNSVGIVDLKNRRVVSSVKGFEQPQGIGYEHSTDTVYVANAGDGSVRLFRGEDFAPITQIPLGDDADNVRVDTNAQRVYVGYGEGALAVIDAAGRKRLADIPLQGHPESFQLEPQGSRIFVNVPDTAEIAVVSRESGQQPSSWSMGELRGNFPLAIDVAHSRVLTILRRPARLGAFEIRTGKGVGGSDVCGDADDMFVDEEHSRLYVVCGEGVVDTHDLSGNDYTRIARLTTTNGSRTGLFLPDLDTLIVAIRGSRKEATALWLLRVQ
jgi:YVTN family beta-propeller protein